MKVNKAKVAVTSLAIAAVAAMVGSISGTVAWFQYSTRASAAFTSATAHATESIEIRVGDGKWKSAIEGEDIPNYIKAVRESEDTALRPVTTGAHKKDGKLGDLYKNPIYQYAAMGTWGKADKMDYVQIPLELRALDIDGAATETTLSKEVYLTKMQIEQPNADADVNAPVHHKDISNALRVHLDSNQNDNDFLVSKTGNPVDVVGKLDLNGNDRDDRTEGWDGFNDEREYVHYGVDLNKFRGEANSVASLLKKFSDAGKGDIYHGSDSKNYVYNGTDWAEVTVGEVGYAGAFADAAAALAVISDPAEGKVYHNTDLNKYYVRGASSWGNAIDGDDFGEFATADAARANRAKANVAQGKIYKNFSDEYFIWDAGSWKNIEAGADYVGEFASNDAAELEIGESKMVDGKVYKDTAATPNWFIWSNGAWNSLMTTALGYLGEYANDAEAMAANADKDFEGKYYKVAETNSFKKYNGTSWEALVADATADGGDAAILELTDPDDGAIYFKTGEGYFRYGAGAWAAVAANATAETDDDAILALMDPEVEFALGSLWTDTSGETNVVKMYTGSEWVEVVDAASEAEANEILDPIQKGEFFLNTAANKYQFWNGSEWKDNYDISLLNADGEGNPELYDNANLAMFAMNQNRHASDAKKLADGDVFYDSAAEEYQKLFIDGEGNWAWGTSAIQAHSYRMNHADITADDSDPRKITGGKVLGKTVVQVADEAALNALKNKAEGDLAYRKDNHLQYVYEGGAWKENVDETVSDTDDFLDTSKVYYLNTVDDDYEIGMYEYVDGEWVVRHGENLRITVTIYLEGWQKLDDGNGGTSAIWNAEDYVGARFNVGLRFSGEAHFDHK